MTEEYRSKQLSSDAFNEKRDCAVLALSFALKITYAAAHDLCREYGRKNGHGMENWQIWNLLKDKAGISSKNAVPPSAFIKRYPGTHKNLKSVTTHHTTRFPEAWQDGERYLVFTNSHIAYIENGVLHDWTGGRAFRVMKIVRLEK